jgi:hypothetical protein
MWVTDPQWGLVLILTGIIDGGGTRGLSTIYILREIFNRIVPNNGGNVRPTEYFDIIGACGPNALMALLFVKFVCGDTPSYCPYRKYWLIDQKGLTIDEALEFYHEVAQKLDRAEDILKAGKGDDLDETDWQEAFESSDPVTQLETVRRGLLDLAWARIITEQIPDWLERSRYKENGEFNYKLPLLQEVGAGICKA